MRIACAQINPTVGDVAGNLKLALAEVARLKNEELDLVVFSELLLTGYPPRDLLFRSDLVADNLAAKAKLVASTANSKTAIAFGYVEQNPIDGGKGLFNAVCVAQDGKVLQERHKTLLPTYDMFEERRYFEPGKPEEILPVSINGTPVGIIICEEAWNDHSFWPKHEYPFDPVQIAVSKGAKYIVSINASPFRIENDKPIGEKRVQMMAEHCKKHNVGCCYANQWGANDEIIFDGNSFALNEQGELIAHAVGFTNDTIIVDTNKKQYSLPVGAFEAFVEPQVIQALTLGVRDYFEKQAPFNEAPAIIGLSGGIDSALTAFIAKEALGANRVIGVAMPSEFSSPGSIDDARALARKLKIKFCVEPIGEQHNAIRKAMDGLIPNLFSGKPDCFNKTRLSFSNFKTCGVSDENVQARLRGMYLMAVANYFGGIVLATGNKSEMAVGYCTIYGDMCGGLAVISDLYKGDPRNPRPSTVFGLCRYINLAARDEIIPWNTINKPPSAELRPDQTDQQSLPPYHELDAILEKFVDEEKSLSIVREEMLEEFDSAHYSATTYRNLDKDIDWACSAVLRNEWKRKQGPPGLKVSRKHWKYGWHMPIVHKMVSNG